MSRATYRECHRNGATYVPLELEAGLIERMTPAMAKSLAIGFAHMPIRVCEQLMRASGMQPPSRSTLDRAARDLGAYAVASSEEIEPLVRANEVMDPRARAAVPMRQGEEGEGVSSCHRSIRRSRPRPKAQTASIASGRSSQPDIEPATSRCPVSTKREADPLQGKKNDSPFQV